MNFSGRAATWSTISGRSMRLCFSTSMRRSPWRWNLLSTAFTSEDFPVPRAPVMSALLAVRPSTNWRVFCSISVFLLSAPWGAESRMRWTVATRWMSPPREVLRQRKAMLACQSTGRDAGSSVSTRSSSASPRLISFSSSDMRSLGPVLGVDGNVFVRQIAGPHGGRGGAAFKHHANRDLALTHHPLPVLLAISGSAAALLRDLDVVEIQLDAIDVEVAHARIADRGEEPPQVRVGGEERGLHQRRMRDRVGDARALLLVAALLHPHGDELGRALAVADDGLRETLRDLQHHVAQRRVVAAPRSARRDHDEGVVGRGVAVDADAVER